MEKFGIIQDYSLVCLTKELAVKYLQRMLELHRLIPFSKPEPDTILCDTKAGRTLHGKWQYSRALFNHEKMIAYVIVYEREAEYNRQYPNHTVYINTVVIDPQYQNIGIGTAIILNVIDSFSTSGFRFLSGPLNFSVQTDKASFNRPVQLFYEKLGFMKRAEKSYGNHVDNVYGLTKIANNIVG